LAVAGIDVRGGSPAPSEPLPRLRLVLAVSLDGRLAPAAGGAAQLGGRGDRRALEEALAWADAVLVGAETLRLHGSTCLIHQSDLLEGRTAAGRQPQPVAVAVSRSGRFPPHLPFFRQPLERWLLAPPASPAATGPVLAGFRRRLSLESWGVALAGLAAAGLEHLVVLGGAVLAADLLAADRVQELQLTLCPRLLGGQHTWLPGAGPLPGAGAWRLLESRSLGGDELLLRYGRADDQRASAVGP
jgi:5-amino-6-(5-phosphoribosylamino)uracil reductase